MFGDFVENETLEKRLQIIGCVFFVFSSKWVLGEFFEIFSI